MMFLLITHAFITANKRMSLIIQGTDCHGLVSVLDVRGDTVLYGVYSTHLLKVVRDVLIPPLAPHDAGCLGPETVLAKLEERRSGIP